MYRKEVWINADPTFWTLSSFGIRLSWLIIVFDNYWRTCTMCMGAESFKDLKTIFPQSALQWLTNQIL